MKKLAELGFQLVNRSNSRLTLLSTILLKGTRPFGKGKSATNIFFDFFTAALSSLIFLRPFVTPYRKRPFSDGRRRLISLKPVQERAGHRQYFSCPAPDRSDAVLITKNASYLKTTPHTSAALGRVGKMVVSHAF